MSMKNSMTSFQTKICRDIFCNTAAGWNGKLHRRLLCSFADVSFFPPVRVFLLSHLLFPASLEEHKDFAVRPRLEKRTCCQTIMPFYIKRSGRGTA